MTPNRATLRTARVRGTPSGPGGAAWWLSVIGTSRVRNLGEGITLSIQRSEILSTRHGTLAGHCRPQPLFAGAQVHARVCGDVCPIASPVTIHMVVEVFIFNL